MAHRADGLNDIFEHNVTVRENLTADNITANKVLIGGAVDDGTSTIRAIGRIDFIPAGGTSVGEVIFNQPNAGAGEPGMFLAGNFFAGPDPNFVSSISFYDSNIGFGYGGKFESFSTGVILAQEEGTQIYAINVTSGDSLFAGDMIFSGEGSGLPYGSFYGDGLTGTYAVNNSFARIADTGCAVGEVNNTTYTDAGTTLTISKAGRYLINYSVSAETHTGAGDHLTTGIMIDSTTTLQAQGKAETEFRAPNSEVCNAGTAIIDCPNGTEVIGVGVGSVDNYTIHVHHVNLSIVQVGG